MCFFLGVKPKGSISMEPSNGVLVLNQPGLCVSQEELHETLSVFAALILSN